MGLADALRSADQHPLLRSILESCLEICDPVSPADPFFRKLRRHRAAGVALETIHPATCGKAEQAGIGISLIFRQNRGLPISLLRKERIGKVYQLSCPLGFIQHLSQGAAVGERQSVGQTAFPPVKAPKFVDRDTVTISLAPDPVLLRPIAYWLLRDLCSTDFGKNSLPAPHIDKGWSKELALIDLQVLRFLFKRWMNDWLSLEDEPFCTMDGSIK